MKLNRLSIVAALALGGLLMLASVSSAQNSNTNTNTRPERRGPNIKQRVDRLGTELNLMDDQKTKVTALFEKEAKEMRDLRAETDGAARREKGRAMRQETDKELKTILTPDQQEKWKQLREQMRQRRQNGAGGAGEAAPAPKPEPKNPDQAQ
jgi:Spy/CpxP family protein refolding chaperone